MQGNLNDDWWLELSLSYFDILDDETRASRAHPRDPAWTPAGTLSDYQDTGWETAEIKLQNRRFLGSDALRLVTGYRYEHYSLGINNFSSDNYAAGTRTALDNASGGDTGQQAAYAQLGWQINDSWDIALGARYEDWQSADGFYYDLTRGNLQDHGNRSEQRLSPKFSIGFDPAANWRVRYSLARAFRFPIVEELFQNERRTAGTSIANASLEPEDGVHQNLMLERDIAHGYVRINLFHERIRDVIFNQAALVDNRSLTTFLPVNEVTTHGVEFIYNQYNLFDRLDVRFNTTWTDTEITRNRLNPAIEHNSFPRMPTWRSHLLLTWHFNSSWDIGGGIRYASDSFGDLDNTDRKDGVFGSQDAYRLVDLRTGYRINEKLRLNMGVENLADEVAYVHHPWPGRTVFVEAALDY